MPPARATRKPFVVAVALAPALTLTLTLAPARAQPITLGPGFSPDPQTLAGYTGGPARATWITRGCPGFIPAVPQHTLTLPGGMAFVRVWAHSEGDATLLVRAPNGAVFCADDTWGRDPGVDVLAAMPGAYEVYVGSYRQGESLPYVLGFTANREGEPPEGRVTPPPVPAFASAPPFALSPGFAPDPGYVQGVAQGAVDAAGEGEGCAGFVPADASHTFTLAAPVERLRLFTHARSDTTLLVRAPGGRVACAHDNYGTQPLLELRRLPPGEYRVFVGTRRANERVPYVLGFSERPEATAAMLGGWLPAGGVPGPGGEGAGGAPADAAVIALPSPGANAPPSPGAGTNAPLVVAGTSGGPSSAIELGHGCRGYLSARPNHVLHLDAPEAFLRVYVTAQSDTTLVVRGPRGELYCADDTYHANPGVDLRRAPAGDYQIFVGSYDPGVREAYQLTVTRSSAQHP